MKKIKWVIAFALVGLLGGGLAAASYVWYQATHVPQTASQTTSTPLTQADLDAARARVIQRITTTEGNRVEADLNSSELSDLVLSAIAENGNNQTLLQGARNFNVQIENGRLKSGVLINFSDLPPESLGETEKLWLENLFSTFPPLRNRPIYLGIEGQPRLENGQLQLDESTIVTLGNLRFSVVDVARQLGISEQQLIQGMRLSLQVDGITIEDLQLEDDRALIRGVSQ